MPSSLCAANPMTAPNCTGAPLAKLFHTVSPAARIYRFTFVIGCIPSGNANPSANNAADTLTARPSNANAGGSPGYACGAPAPSGISMFDIPLFADLAILNHLVCSKFPMRANPRLEPAHRKPAWNYTAPSPVGRGAVLFCILAYVEIRFIVVYGFSLTS